MNKQVIAINDLCGLGHCSLAAALPVISVMGHQVLPAPTAILSTQTDGFSNYTNVDLSPHLHAYLAHWQAQKVKADALYSGYLASAAQIDEVNFAINQLLKKEHLILIDPVLGDEGCLYDTMDTCMVQSMQKLIKNADIITPNVTELAILADEDPKAPYDEIRLKNAMQKLANQGPKTIVTTSFAQSNNQISTAIYSKADDSLSHYFIPKEEGHYPGTGDLFACVLLGELLREQSLQQAVQVASHFVANCIKLANEEHKPAREGVPFEKLLGQLII